MIHQLVSVQEMEDQNIMFAKLDKNQDGFLDRNEIACGLREIYDTVTEEDLDEVMNNVDMNANGFIDFSEWLVATLKHEHIIDETRVQ